MPSQLNTSLQKKCCKREGNLFRLTITRAHELKKMCFTFIRKFYKETRIFNFDGDFKFDIMML